MKTEGQSVEGVEVTECAESDAPPDGSADAWRTQGRVVSRRFEPLDLHAEADPGIWFCSQNEKGVFMKNQISAGAILVEEGTLVPDSFTLDREPYSSGWGLLKNPDRRELGANSMGRGGRSSSWLMRSEGA
jgi:hypothetical protein